MKGSPNLDPACLARARRGDPEAFRAVYQHCADPVYRFLARMLGNPAAAEDALQETFLRVLRALPGFDPDGQASLTTWVLTIARRVALNGERASQRAHRRERDAMAFQSEAAPPIGADDGGELRRALEAAVADLPPDQRSVFVLREGHALSYDEIAVIEQVDLGTVKSRLYRARMTLQARLRQQNPDAFSSPDRQDHERNDNDNKRSSGERRARA